MRMIDADNLKKSVTNEMLKAEPNSEIYCTLECVIADIDSQPTVLDVDKVKNKLNEESEKSVLVTLKAAFKVAIEIIEAELKR